MMVRSAILSFSAPQGVWVFIFLRTDNYLENSGWICSHPRFASQQNKLGNDNMLKTFYKIYNLCHRLVWVSNLD